MIDCKRWLSNIDDNRKITQLSIPGTHNSAACYTALPSIQCQGRSIEEQLNHGVRFLDIRVGKMFLVESNKAEDLQVIHGKFPVKIPFPLKFSSVLEEIYAFLERNPSETVIVSLKQEGINNWDNERDEFPNWIWDHYLSKNKDKWYLKTNIPKLRDCRGKAILFRRFGVCDERNKSKFGFEASSWNYNTIEDDRGTFVVQDYCEIQNSEDIQKKLGYVKSLAKKSMEYCGNSDNKLFVNFTTASNFFNPDCWPQKVARSMINGGIEEVFNRSVGIIIFDFVESDNWRLVTSLVNKNF